MAIKAVFFDLDDTLYDTSGFTEKLRLEACQAMIDEGLPAKDANEAYGKLATIIAQEGSNSENHFDRLCIEYGVEFPAPIVAAGVVAYHEMKVGMHPIPGAVSMLMQLIKKGYKLALITNGIGVKQWDKILRLKIREYFDVILVSDVSKTSTGKDDLIREALHKLELQPEEVLFVGDNLETDIASANRCGIATIRFLHGNRKSNVPKSAVEQPHLSIESIADVPSAIERLS